MPSPESAEARTFVVHVSFLSGAEPFGAETYTLILPRGHDVSAAAQALAETSQYWDLRVPDLAKRIVFVPVEDDDPDPPPDGSVTIVSNVGRYLVLSTSHIRCASGRLLDRWATLSPMDRPLAVASSLLGWFVPTDNMGPAISAMLPDEIPPILAFARSRGCGYVLFDYAAAAIAELPCFPW